MILQIDKYIAPSGMMALALVVVLSLVITFFYLRYKYRRLKATPLRIRKKTWYSGGLKMSVTVKNVSKSLVEIDTPVLEFRQPRMHKRKFKIITRGTHHVFPLGLSPQTNYDFLVEFTPLYEREPSLRKYQTVYILINGKNGKNGKTIIKRKVKIKLPS